jgi:hypothetical protein
MKVRSTIPLPFSADRAGISFSDYRDRFSDNSKETT